MAASIPDSHASNWRNALIAILSPLPSILFYIHFLRHHTAAKGGDFLYPLWIWCYRHPILLANALFFININVLFWLIGFIQSNHWMIDLYWTVIPVLLVHYFANQPIAECNSWRSWIVIILTWIWSVRLTHSYFRRENWQWGAREDWRFNNMRHQYGKHWWWVSFSLSTFLSSLELQVFLMGICTPLYIVHSKDQPLNSWDLVATLVCLTGITIAYYAYTQLHNFVSQNNELKNLGRPLVPNLDTGLWYYSRHPNYFGEQLWWWGLAIFAWNLGYGLACVGALVNSLCLVYVTILVEERMMKQQYRVEAYKSYQKTTSVWIPWRKASAGRGKDKES